MTRRQTMPEQWFIADARTGAELWRRLGKLPRGSGVLVLCKLDPFERCRLRYLARQRQLAVAWERPGIATRVHNAAELRNALLRQAPLILLSPIYPTSSHPEWMPLPRMRAAALARLGGRRLYALGGMDAKRYARIAPLGFIGWAGIRAWSRARVHERPAIKHQNADCAP